MSRSLLYFWTVREVIRGWGQLGLLTTEANVFMDYVARSVMLRLFFSVFSSRFLKL